MIRPLPADKYRIKMVRGGSRLTRLVQKALSILVAIALLITMAPISPAKAAGSTFFQFTDFSTVQASPTVVNANIVSLSGTFGDVSSESITYKVQRMVNGSPVGVPSIGTSKPLISGKNFVFTGVQLFDGLNEITVSGVSLNGGEVSASSYVSFSNVPVITSIELAGGVKLVEGKPEIVTTEEPTILVKATNAKEVAINGSVTFEGIGGTFIHSDITLLPGVNKLEIVSRNGSKSYTVYREIVYFPAGRPTAHHVYATSGATSIQLDGQQVVAPFLNHTLEGTIILANPDPNVIPAPPLPVITLGLSKDNAPATTYNTNVTLLNVTATHREYKFVSTTTASTTGNGYYSLSVTSTYDGVTSVFPVNFSVRSASSPYISDIRQLYSVTPSDQAAQGIVTFESDTKFSNNATVSQLPLWLSIDANNFNLTTAGHTSTVAVSVNGSPVSSSNYSIKEFRAATGGIQKRVYRIDALPPGEVKLDFTITNGTDSYTESRTFINSPISSIQVTNLYDGAIYYDDNQPVSRVAGKLINFKLPADLSSLKLSLNGVTIPMTLVAEDGDGVLEDSEVNLTSGDFIFPLGLNLVFGSNELVLSGSANGVLVSTTLTLYRFSKTQPAITNMQPVPYKIDPRLDVSNERYTSDLDHQFTKLQTNSFTTTQQKADLLFTVANLENLIIKVDGKDLATATVDAGGVLNYSSPIYQNYLYTENSNIPTKTYKLRLFGLTLPQSGPMSITITALVGSESITQTITITRELSPYELLSPKLPQEKVINQNFLNVSIRAEGADRVLIGKAEMTKKVTEDLFRYQVKNLRAGTNKIKFTVFRGTEKIDGEFSVNYAADNTIGAQYKASLTSNGKVSAFKGELALSFPKNTFLRSANLNPGQSITNSDLFDSQEILFGIADRNDGRTVKVYNAVEDNAQNVALDGTFKTVSYDEIGAAMLRPSAHFGFASNLFWIDPGYVQGSQQQGYTFSEGAQPYVTNNFFFTRPLTKWLEPSNKGQVTIKYDSSIRDVTAATLSIWRFYDGRWSNLGGKVNTGKKTITADMDGFGYYVVKTIRYSFSDVVGHNYARNSLELLFSHGLMNYKDNNEFGVYDNITRGEFAQLLVKMFQIPLDYDPNNMTFDDVRPILGLSNLWDYRYIETAARKGIIRGSGPRLFQPNEDLSREEAAVMIARAGNLVKNGAENFDKDRKALQKLFTDSNLIENYSLASVLAITKAKYIEGMPNTQTAGKQTFRFDPDSPLKRADAAVIAERVMRKLKFL